MSNSAVVGVLRALLTLDTAEYEQNAKKAANQAKQLEKDFKSFGRSAVDLGGSLTKAFTVPLVGIGAGAIKVAMDFESAFADVRKTVDASDEELDGLAQTFRDMAKEIPATTEELSKIAALGGQMGVPISQMASFTEHVAALGVAVDGISTEDAAAGLAQIGNIAGTGTSEIGNMASALVHLGNKSNATEADILEFTKRLAGAGTSVGMTVPEVMALGTAMANVGINAEAGGTAMSKVITKISVAVSEGGDKLREFAKVADMSATEFAATFKRSPIEAIDAFIKGLATMKARGVDINLTMGEVGTEADRVADTLKRLAGAGTGVSDSLKIAIEGFSSGNKHLEEAEKKYATTSKQLQLLWNNIRDVGITLGNALIPFVKSAIDVVGAFVPVIETLAKTFAALPTSIQAVAVAIGVVAAAAGPLLFVFGQLSLSAATLAGNIGKGTLAANALTVSLNTLKQAASVAGVAFAGWTIGRWIADLTKADEAIEEFLTHANELKKLRGGDAATRASLLKLEADAQEKLNKAKKEGSYWDIQAARGDLDRIKQDQTRLAMLDTINIAITKGAAETITYGDAVKFLAAANEKQIQAARDAAAQTDKLKQKHAEASQETDEHRKAVAKLVDELGGAGLAREVKQLEQAWNSLTPAQKANAEVIKRVAEAADELAKKGATLPATLAAVAMEGKNLSTAVSATAVDMNKLSDGLPGSIDLWKKQTETWLTAALGMSNLRDKLTSELPDFAKMGAPADLDTWKRQFKEIGDEAERLKKAMEAYKQLQLDTIVGGLRDVGSILAAGAGFSELAGQIDQLVNKLVHLSEAAKAAGKSLSGTDVVAAGATFGLSLFADWVANSRAQLSALRDEFDALFLQLRSFDPDAKAHVHPFNPNDVEAYRHAIEELRAQLQPFLDEQERARREAEKLKQAIADFGLGIANMNPGEAFVEITNGLFDLEKTFHQLIDAGYNYDDVLEKMAPKWVELIRLAQQFGIEVPESMRPILDDLQKMGFFMDENTAKAVDKAKAKLAELDSELKSLQQMVDAEAPEEVMGVIEARARERIAELEKEKAHVQSEIDDLMGHIETAFANAGATIAQTLADTLAHTPITIPIQFEWPEMRWPVPTAPSYSSDFEWPEIPNLNEGTHGMYPNWGPQGTVVRLHDREAVVPLSDARGGASALSMEALQMEMAAMRRDFRTLPSLLIDAGNQRGR